ncbi:E1 [Mastomys coucha papillomavirus 2]|uniref:Replication protein E1 n=1 Tax=Mastomys coucha papillomavirus 2 TaxID=392505 RepID=Q06RH3_9PAPI|nr:E1 [Mastomys coucha papillomavirus 2]ABG56159.1 E1 [Mastomys coucha papillomavirus 2]
MDAVNKGTGWCFIEDEAECEDGSPLDNFEALFEQSTQGSFLDNEEVDEVDRGNHLALFTQQLFSEDDQHIAALKRKYAATPRKGNSLEIESLSPRLHSCSISPKGKQSRRRLFEDSGIGNETQNTTPETAEVPMCMSGSTDSGTTTTSGSLSSDDLLRMSNRVAASLARFKDAFSVSFSDLTRSFKSDKTCSVNWVTTVFGAREPLLEALLEVLKPQCDYFQTVTGYAGERRVDIILFEFKVGKSRNTLRKQMAAMLGLDEKLIMADPPNHRSTLAALFFYKKVLFGAAVSRYYGQTPAWIAQQTILEHQKAGAETFDFSKMVQWAYDNQLIEESEIAYRYACEAETDANAQAWLKCTNQVKHVRDCCAMVRLYKRQEMRDMTMAQWVRKCCDDCEGEGDWKTIAGFLRYQEVNMVLFLTALRHMFKGTPKKHCLVISGPPDTGKSYFCNSLNTFLHGRVISFMNSKSQFWLQPLVDAKMGFLDDATNACWTFMDIYMRNALDGNPMQVDMKHRAPLQLKLPPLLITTNVDVMHNDNYKYLHSRLQCFAFEKPMPLNNDGHPQFPLHAANWKSFFTRLAKQLGIEEEEGENELPGSSFRCSARTDTESIRERQY